MPGGQASHRPEISVEEPSCPSCHRAHRDEIRETSHMPIPEKHLLINNEWRPSSSGKTMEVVNPATEEVIASVASAGTADVDAAVAAARAALAGPWGTMSARERGRLVSRLADRLMERADEVARLETIHNGKPIGESRHDRDSGGGRVLRVLRRLGRQSDGRDHPRQGQPPHLHAPRAHWRRRGHRAVELSAVAGGVEGRAGTRVRQHRHPQACQPDAADGDCARRDSDRESASRPAC